MKVGIRKPSIKKSISARTTGKYKRKLKSTVNPLYGIKGMGLINNPKKAVYNKVYSKTTVSSKSLAGFLLACVWYPIYWSGLLCWWVLKYSFLAVWWIFVLFVRGCAWIFKKLAALFGKEQDPATE